MSVERKKREGAGKATSAKPMIITPGDGCATVSHIIQFVYVLGSLHETLKSVRSYSSL